MNRHIWLFDWRQRFQVLLIAIIIVDYYARQFVLDVFASLKAFGLNRRTLKRMLSCVSLYFRDVLAPSWDYCERVNSRHVLFHYALLVKILSD